MKTILTICFSTPGFRNIQIENPAFIPLQGEVFECKWEDYIEDKAQMKKLNKKSENNCWLVERLSSYFSKNCAECRIVLHESIELENSL